MNLDRIIAVRNNKTIYRDGDRCLKVFNADFTKADVLSEALNQARIEETGIRIPAILEVTRIDGKWAVISQYIRGKTLAQLLEENPDKREEYLQLFVNLQLEVLQKTCKELVNIREDLRLKICMTDLPATTRYALHALLESMPKRSKICHGDYYPANIIVTADGTPYILDWSHATQGNASADVAHTYLLLCYRGQKDFADRYLELFCEKTGAEPSYVRRWFPITAAAMLPEANAAKRAFLYPFVTEAEYE